MPWKERTVSQMREEFVVRAIGKEKSKAELCREYGISRPTGDKWIKRYLDGKDLNDQSRKPHRIERTSPEVEQAIVDYRGNHQGIGATKIRQILINAGMEAVPCARTVNNILKRNGLISREASAAATPYRRFERDEPNQMWQADYKGHFALENGQRCHPLNIIDDHSRFNICCKAHQGETLEEIKPTMTHVFREYGLPSSLLCDNGPPWGTSQSVGFTHFEVWLMELGVLVLHGRPLHPQTQGKEERFNRSMKCELLKFSTMVDFEDAQRQFDDYRQFYNNERPHHALDLDVPSKHYMPSKRAFPEQIRAWEYPEGIVLRKVKSSGYFTWNGQGYFLSEAFGGKEIGIRESHIPGCISLFFRQFRIARIDIEKRVFTLRRAYLIEGDPRLSKDKP